MSMIARPPDASLRLILVDARNRKVWASLLAADALLIVLHVVHFYFYSDVLPDLRYSIGHDGGFGEIAQYIKEGVITLALLAIGVRSRRPLYFVWMGVFGYFLADDAFQIHERLGGWLAERLGYLAIGGLRAKDFGEITVSAIAGAVFAVGIVISWIRARLEERRAAETLTAFVMLLAVFGIGFDLLHSIARASHMRYLRGFVGLAEDGGEMIVMSVACAYAVGLWRVSVGRSTDWTS